MTLKEFFTVHNKIALGFSGGVDSSFLLYTAIKYGADIKPYFIKTAFQPEFELEDVMKLASQLNIEPEIIRIDVLQNEKVTKNPKNRCYFCKNTQIVTASVSYVRMYLEKKQMLRVEPLLTERIIQMMREIDQE